MPANPTKIDPTRSITLRRSFAQKLTVEFSKLKTAMWKLLVEEDALGLVPDKLPFAINKESHEYSSTQFNIGDGIDRVAVGEVLTEIQRLKQSLSPEDVIRIGNTPHVTVRYGLLDLSTTFDGVKALLSEYGEVKVRLGKLSLFAIPGKEVLKVEVESEQLREMNSRLKMLPNVQDFPLYQPHITVAYLQPGTGAKYLNDNPLEGRELSFDKVVFSTSTGETTKLSLRSPLTANKRWKFKTQTEAVTAFDEWLGKQVNESILSQAEANRWKRYIERGFEKGANRAFVDVQKGARRTTTDIARGEGFIEGQREQFLRTALGRLAASEKVKLLSRSALDNVQGMADDLKNKARQILTDGLVRGLSPRGIADSLWNQLDISKQRADTIAFTELVRAHAEGQLEAMELLGVKTVGVAVEWVTAKDPCKACEPLKGIVLKLTEARGMLPRHPRCRCAWVPANVGENEGIKSVQKRSMTKIKKAIKRSQKEAGDSEEWGPNKEISKKRPASTLNTLCCDDHLLVFSKLLGQIGEQK